jgi:hypothetical protein
MYTMYTVGHHIRYLNAHESFQWHQDMCNKQNSGDGNQGGNIVAGQVHRIIMKIKLEIVCGYPAPLALQKGLDHM